MRGDEGRIIVDGIPVEVVRRPVKHLRLGVYPLDGRVRIVVPPHVDDAAVRAAVESRVAWIRRQQAWGEALPRPSPREMVSGERHHVAGRPYRLRVVEEAAPPKVSLRGRTLELRVRPGSDRDKRLAVLEAWHRERLRAQVAALVAAWEPRMGVTVAEVGIRRMRTRWGTCNRTARRIWLRLELATRPPACLEYVVVHEMVHLLAWRHDARFWGLMDRFLPEWRRLREELNTPQPDDEDQSG